MGELDERGPKSPGWRRHGVTEVEGLRVGSLRGSKFSD